MTNKELEAINDMYLKSRNAVLGELSALNSMAETLKGLTKEPLAISDRHHEAIRARWKSRAVSLTRAIAEVEDAT